MFNKIKNRQTKHSIPLAIFILCFAVLGVYFLWHSFATTAEVEVAKGKPATSSSIESSAYPAQNANDGNTSTRWSSQYSNNQWWQVDLGSLTTVNQVNVNWETAYASHYYIQTSTDGVNFTTAADVTDTSSGIKNTTFNAVTARYVRIFGITRATQYGFSILEVQVFAPIVEYAQGKSATASSTEKTNYAAQNANDGNTATRWSSSYSNNQWWQVDLGSAQSINRVDINWETAYASHYYIQTSTDGSNFNTAADVTDTSSGLKSTNFSLTSARYVRILGLSRATKYGISIWEVQVYGPLNSSTPTPVVPTANLTVTPAAINAGQIATLSWSSTNATACSSTGGNWTGSQPLSGSASTGPVNSNTTYSLTCTGAGGTVTQSATLTVNTPINTGTPITAWVPSSSIFTPESDALAASQITNVSENRPGNTTANNYIPTTAELTAFHSLSVASNPYNKYVDGLDGIANPSTDDLIQWGAHKWGIPEDWLRAEYVQESYWRDSTLGDEAAVSSTWYNQYPAQARVANSLNVYESMGITQVKWRPDNSVGPGTEPLRWESTAFNIDYQAAAVRYYFDGKCSWCGTGYSAGQQWNSIGAWFSPVPWGNSGQESYISSVQNNLANRTWAQPGF